MAVYTVYGPKTDSIFPVSRFEYFQRSSELMINSFVDAVTISVSGARPFL